MSFHSNQNNAFKMFLLIFGIQRQNTVYIYTYIYIFFYCAKETVYVLIRKLRDKTEDVLMSLYDIFNYLPEVIICKLTE